VQEALPEAARSSPLGCGRLALAPVTVTTEEMLMRPVSRGRGQGGPMTLRVLGPLGLAWWQRRLELPWDVTVFPSLVASSLRALLHRHAVVDRRASEVSGVAGKAGSSKVSASGYRETTPASSIGRLPPRRGKTDRASVRR
jgi:hypothetical protein